VGEGHFGVDQLLNLVLVVAAVLAVPILVPALPIPVVVVVVLERAMRRLDIGEREDGLAARPPGRGPKQGHAASVGAFQPGPGQRALGVLVVEEVDESARRIGHRPAVIAGHWRAEVLTQEVRQFGDGPLIAVRTAGVAVQEQIVGERDPVSRPHRENLVTAVGVEGDQRQRRL
jgi:hypothetical protein